MSTFHTYSSDVTNRWFCRNNFTPRAGTEKRERVLGRLADVRVKPPPVLECVVKRSARNVANSWRKARQTNGQGFLVGPSQQCFVMIR